jgi:two-component system cell cycle sensor histidine kinase/response regulator CckA
MTLVLLAEDEHILRLLAAEALQDAGLEVLQARDGQEALELLRTNDAIEVLISDVKMPRMDGYDLARAGLSLRPALKILMMTGYAQDPPGDIFTNGEIEILRKPFDLEKLSEAVKSLIEPA